MYLVGPMDCLLHLIRDELPGRVLLVFQPSEAMFPIGGARSMMDDGVFEEYEPDMIFAQHVRLGLSVGQIGVRQRAVMSIADSFEVVIERTAGHVSSPHQTTDAVATASQVINAL